MNNLCIHTVNVSRPTASKGTSGGEKDTYTTVYTGLVGMVQPVSATWQVMYSQRKIDVTHTFFTNQNPTIKNGDKIIFGTRTFLVRGFRNLNEMGRVTAVDCEELL